MLITLFLLLSGVVLTMSQQGRSDLENGAEQKLLVKLLEPPDERTTSLRVLAKVTNIFDDDELSSANEKVMLYFSATDTLAKTLKFGSVLAVKGNFESPGKPLNPYQFDYEKYLAKKQIYRVAFIDKDSWKEIGYKPNKALNIAFSLRDNMLSLYRGVGIEDENLAILSALTLGYKNLLDQETRRVFSASGAMHILAVSGLHVGILFATLSAILFFLNRIKKGRLFKTIILLIFLWFFAVFTGLSPSVIRASLMFSLVIIGMAFSRKTNIYNTLSASAFIILVVNPMLITEVGFQLSYLAVVSIVFFYPYIYKLVYIKNKWVDKVWVLISVSIAAQLGTFVLGLYYFNQFPNYFLLTNLYAIPLATIIIYLALLLIVVSPLPAVATVVGWVLNNVLSWLVSLIKFTEALPYSTFSGIAISASQVFFLLLAILMLALFLAFRKAKIAYVMLAALLLFFAELSFRQIGRFNNSELVVFGSRQSTLVGFKNADSFLLAVSDTSSQDIIKQHNYSLGGYLSSSGINADGVSLCPFAYDNKKNFSWVKRKSNKLGIWYSFNGEIIFIPIDNGFDNLKTKKPFPVDILVVTNQLSSRINKVLNLVKPKIVVVDATLPYWKIDSIKENVHPLEIEFHYITEQGAFIKEYDK